MPLTPKGRTIMAEMHKEYGDKKGTSVFYASANKGTIKGIGPDSKKKKRKYLMTGGSHG